MPGQGSRLLIILQYDADIVYAPQFDLRTADNDLTERFYCYGYPVLLLEISLVASDLGGDNYVKLDYPDERFNYQVLLPDNSLLTSDVDGHIFTEVGQADEMFYCYGNPVLLRDTSLVASDVDGDNFTKLDGPQERMHQDHVLKKEYVHGRILLDGVLRNEYIKACVQLATSPKNVREIKKGCSEAWYFQFPASSKDVLEIKEWPQSWGFQFAAKTITEIKKEHAADCRFYSAPSPKIVLDMIRIPPSPRVVGMLPATDNWMVTGFVLYLDSGAGCHAVHQPQLLTNLRDPPPGLVLVKAADGAILPVAGYGDILTEHFSIPNVCLVLGLTANLVSVAQLVRSHNVSCSFYKNGCDVTSYDTGLKVGGALLRDDNQYVLNFLEIP